MRGKKKKRKGGWRGVGKGTGENGCQGNELQREEKNARGNRGRPSVGVRSGVCVLWRRQKKKKWGEEMGR